MLRLNKSRYYLLVSFVLLSACSAVPELLTSSAAPQQSSAVLVPSRGETSTADALIANPYRKPTSAVDDETREQILVARNLLYGGQVDRAKTEFQRLAQEHPRLSGPLYYLAVIALKKHEWQQALELADRALAVNENNIYALNLRAIALRSQGLFDAAESSYKESLSRWPAYADAHRNLGILYDLYLGRTEEALFHYQRYVAIAGEDADPRSKIWIQDLQRRLPREQHAQK